MCKYLFLFVPLLFAGCMKEEVFPAEPAILHESITSFPDRQERDSVLQLTFRFTDGDGDIGLLEQDTAPPYKVNFMITLYRLQNGQWVYDPNARFHGRIPYMRQNIKRSSLKGTIDMKLFMMGYPADTVRFEYYILDRALHPSNTVTTPEIILKR